MLPRFLLALLATGAFAAETDEPVLKDKAIYFHPLFTVVSASLKETPLYIPITFENELEGGKSIVVQPTLTIGSIEEESDDGYTLPSTDVFGIQMMAALRKYFNGDHCSGVYAAPAVMLAYVKAERSASSWYSAEKASAIGFGALAYLGARGKWESVTTYIDIGVGHQWVSVSGDSNTNGVSADGLLLDVNLGIGIPF
jgi:hypothetical protein